MFNEVTLIYKPTIIAKTLLFEPTIIRKPFQIFLHVCDGCGAYGMYKCGWWLVAVVFLDF